MTPISATQSPWTTLDPTANIMQMGQETAPNSLAGIGFTPEFLRQIGYTGPDPMSYRNGENQGIDPAFVQFLQSKGIKLANSTTPRTTRGSYGTTQLGAFDAQGNQIAQQNGTQDDGSTGAALGALVLGGGFAAATAAGAGAAGAAGGGSGGSTNAALIESQLGTPGYGASGSGLSGLGDVAYQPYTGPGSTGYQVAGDGAGSTGDVAANYGATNPALIDSAAQSPGYGASSAGVGGGAGDVSGIAGPTAGGVNPITGQAANINPITGQPFTPAMNSTLADSAAGTAGYGASSAGAGGGAGDLSGITGPTVGSSWQTQLQNALTTQGPNGTNGLSGLGQSLLGGGLGALTGALGKGNTSDLNKVDYQGAATAMGQSARTNQTNAQGSLTYNQNGTDVQGNPTYSQDVKLNAPYQSNLNQALGNQGTALGNLGDYNKNLQSAYASVPGLYGDAGSQSALAKQQQDAMYDQQKRYLDPQYDLQSKQLAAQLANQGVSYGSDAYNSAMTQFGSQQNQAYGAARDSAINSGNAYANTLFNQNLAAHQTGMSDINNQGTNYLNQSSGALNGVTQNPTFAATPPPTNYLGAAQQQGQANLNQYNANIGNTNNLTNGLFNIGSSLASNPSVWSSIGSGLGGLFNTGP